MIARIEGMLVAMEADRALVKLAGGLTFELLLPAFTAARLAARVGEPVLLHTLSFFESQNQGATILPRLAGFPTVEDRQFFELFVTCKGIGHRRALRAMTLATNLIAVAIADRDLAMLQSLPEVGRRTAETIAVTLRDKVDRFISAAAYPGPSAGSGGGPAGGRDVGPGEGSGEDSGVDPGVDSSRTTASKAREAMEVLLQLGERRTDIAAWIDQVLARRDAPRDAESLIAEVYRIKSGG